MARLDIVIFGATGFTGKHCIPYMVKAVKENGRSLTWGIAGRSEDKLKAVLKEMGDKIEVNLESIPIIIADVKDQESLLNMAKKARLVMNCCGPYRLFGEPVVKACLEAETHHIDVSGEPQYITQVELNHHDEAQQKGIYLISACGMDSIPTDLGIIHLQQNFKGTLNSVETYLKGGFEGSVKGSLVNYGTWKSAIYGISHWDELHSLKKKFNEKFKKTPTYPPKLKFKVFPHKSKVGDGWALPFLGSDRSIARRSQSILYENDNVRPAQIGTYIAFPSVFVVFMVMLYGLVFGLLSRFKYGVKLLLDYPEWFSYGFFSKKSPQEETIDKCWFSVDFYGEGWKEKLADKDDQYTTPVDSVITGKVKGRNPGYGTTCLCLVLAGIVILTEKEKLVNNGMGGVYPPGISFAKTSLVKQLNEGGLTFEIQPQVDIKSA
ncbi:saccharopine dehydrogenase-like oxidoreductase [Euwallacea fornicatus]|uniref:saccharopine dehydrogenase-like oxidoreductase n=1 Tax=Euwallacea fornicatus TaxID=995702 RepID=UPI00338F8300